MENKFLIRFITNADCEEALEVYRPYVTSTSITFDYDVPAIEDFNKKVEKVTFAYPWLVCTFKNRVIGYAYASRHRDKSAYQWSAESTVYLSVDFHRKGIATILYESLFSILRLQGYANVYAGVTLPNEKSEGFHKALGFNEIGIFKNIGFKLGQWHDVKWFQLHLSEHNEHPTQLKSIKEIEKLQKVQSIMDTANKKLNAILESESIFDINTT